jgi:hypothetical protein
MKLYLTINSQPLNGYTTIDPFGGIGKIALDHKNLDSVCETNECTEIYGPNILDYIHISSFNAVIDHYISKLRHGGRLILGGTDIRDISKKIIKDDITLADVNFLLYGPAPFNWLAKCGAHTMHDVTTILKEKNLEIISQKCDELKFIIEAKRA